MTNKQDPLVERQFERMDKIIDTLAGEAMRADDPECHPLYPQAVAARQILSDTITRLTAERDALRGALERVERGLSARRSGSTVMQPVSNEKLLELARNTLKEISNG